MSRRKSGPSAGLVGLLGIAIGAGLGFLASKILTDDEKVQQKKKVPVLQSSEQKEITKTDINNYDELQELMICPITHEIMTEPCVLTTCGHSFEKKFIVDWIQKKQSCPLCNKKAKADDIQVNYQLKQVIHYYQKNKNNTKKQGEKKQQK